MTDVTDFDRLARNWLYWSGRGQLQNLSISTDCADCEVLFGSDDYSVHLRDDGTWWCVDTVNDRRQRSNDTAKFSSYALAEKYLVWIWGSTARSVLRAPVLGQKLYAKGFASSVERTPIREGLFELRSPAGRAMLVEPYATIFSHLMGRSEEDIEQMLQAGV